MNSSMRIQVRVIANEAIRELNRVRGGVTGVTQAAQRGRGMLSGLFDRDSLRATSGFGSNLQWIGRQLEYRFTLPLLAAGAAATKFQLANETAITRLRKVYGSLTDAIAEPEREIQELGRAFRALSDIYGVHQDEVIGIAAAWAQAGASGAGLARVTRTTLDAMILGEIDHAKAVESLIILQSQYNLTSQELTETLAFLNVIENELAVGFEDLIDSITRGGGAAREMGVGLRELAAMTASLVPTAGSATTAGNSLKTILTRIVAPTDQAADALRDLGLNIDGAGWQSMNALERLQALGGALEEVSTSERARINAVIAGTYQVARFSVLIRDLTDAEGRYAKAIEATGGATVDNAKNMAQYNREIGILLSSQPQAFKILMTQMQNLMAEIVVPLLPGLISVGREIVGLVRSFTELSPAIQKVVIYGAVFLAALGPLLAYAGALSQLRVGLAFVGHLFFGVGKAALFGFGIFTKLGDFILGPLRIAGHVLGGLGTVAWTAVRAIAVWGQVAVLSVARAIPALMAGTGQAAHAFARFAGGIVNGVFYIVKSVAWGNLMTSLLWVREAAWLMAFHAKRLGALVALYAKELAWHIWFHGRRIAATVAFGARELAWHVGFHARRLAATAVLYARELAWHIAFHGRRIAATVVLYAKELAWHIGFHAQRLAGSAIAYARELALTAAHYAKMAALAVGRVAFAALMVAREVALISAGWVLRHAIEVANWAKARALQIGGWLAAKAIALAGSAAVAIASTGWIGILVAAVAGLAVAIWKNIGGIRDFLVRTWHSIVDGIASVVNRLPESVYNAFNTVVGIVKRAALAVYEWLQWINPFARHSPSLVEQVTDGVDIISKKYASLSGVGAVFRKASADFREFMRATEAARASLKAQERSEAAGSTIKLSPGASPAVGALMGSLTELDAALALVGTEFTRQEGIVADWARAVRDAEEAMNTPELRAMAAAIKENELAQAELRLELLRMEQAGQSIDDLRDRYASLSGEIEMLRGEATTLRQAGAGSDVLSVLDDRINSLEAERDALEDQAKAAKSAQDELDALKRQGDILRLQQEIALAPLKERLDAVTEVYDAEKAKLDELGDAYDAIEDQIRKMESALSDMGRAAESAAAAAGDAANAAIGGGPGFEIPGGDAAGTLGREGGLADITALADQWSQEAASMFDVDLFGGLKDKFKAGWSWLQGQIENARDWLRERLDQFGGSDIGNSLTGSARNVFSTYRRLYGDMFTEARRRISDIAGFFVSSWTRIIEIVSPIFGRIRDVTIDKLRDIWNELRQFSDLWDPLLEATEHVWNVIWTIVKAVAGAILAVFYVVWPSIENVVVAVWEGILEVITAVLQVIRGVIQFVLGVINGDWELAWEGIKNIVGGVWDAIYAIVSTVLEAVWGVIRGLWDRLMEFGGWLWNGFLGLLVRPAVEALKTAFDAVKNPIVAVFDGIKSGLATAWNGIISVIEGGVNLAISGVNLLISGLNKISDVLPGIDFHIGPIGNIALPRIGGGGGGGGGSLPSRGAFAQGGRLPATDIYGVGPFVTSGARAIVGEGSPFYPEYVIPTDPRFRGRASSLYGQLGSDLGMFERGGVMNGKETGGPFDWVAEQIGDIAKGIRQGMVTAAFAPFMPAIDAAISRIPWDYLREIATGGKNAFYDWARGVNSEVDRLAGTSKNGIDTTSTGQGAIPTLINFMKRSGVAHRVTSTMRPGSVTASGNMSLHAVGRAVDFAGLTPSRDSEALAAIFRAFRPMESQLKELIYAGPQVSYNIKNGQRVAKYAQAQHHDHVHAALKNGGIVRRTPGGVIARLGEGRTDELVTPLPNGFNGVGAKKEYHFHGDLSFPNIKDPDDAEKFIRNLEALASD